MGVSRDNFIKSPRTPHLFGSTGTDDDRRLDQKASEEFLASSSLIAEEKLDGTNVGIHFTSAGQMILQCRGHEITEGMHPQYDLFKQWTAVKRSALESILSDRHILYGEWLYARHTVHYLQLPHFLIVIDLCDKVIGAFLDRESRLGLLQDSGFPSVPLLRRGPLTPELVSTLISQSRFGSRFENPVTGAIDDLMEGIYFRTESKGLVTSRAKFVRPEFVCRARESEGWRHRSVVPNELATGVDIWRYNVVPDLITTEC